MHIHQIISKLLVLGIVIGVAFQMVACDESWDLTDQEHLSRAEDFLSQGKSEDAAIELKNALLKNPKNPRARWLLGKLNLEMGSAPAAERS